MGEYSVYMHTCPNGKVYIGITKQNPKYRWGKNGNKYNNNRHFYNAILKYGWDNIKHEIVCENLTPDEAYTKEQELIVKYKSNKREYGYNNSTGGESGASGCRWNEESRKAFSKFMIGKPSNKKGKPMTEETRRKLSKKLHGRIISQETRKRMSDNSTKKRRVKCIELNKIFDSGTQAGKETSTNASHITQCCKGKRKTAGGYKWEYAEQSPPYLNAEMIETR